MSKIIQARKKGTFFDSTGMRGKSKQEFSFPVKDEYLETDPVDV